jgi:aminoglycoside 6'-N-acetyltransferase
MSGSISPCDYTFAPVVADHLTMLGAWLRTPEVTRWWGDPDEQLALLAEDVADGIMVMRLVGHRGQPFGYVQDYSIDQWPQPHLAGLPAGSRAMDAFIGVPDMIGRGHGQRFLRLRAEQLLQAGASVVAIDPDATNMRAQRAYQGAGFRPIRRVETAEGPVVLMVFQRQAPVGG